MDATNKPTRVKRELDGLLLLDKPRGMSSNQALQRVKWLLRAKKAGHTGTLDPLATGLLPICLGEATKFSRFQLGADKIYRVVAHFGAVSDTGDCEGEVVRVSGAVAPHEQEISAALPKFIGNIDQRPPVYSAIKKNGRRLCDYARDGIVIEPELRRVKVSRFDLVKCEGSEAEFLISCSKGTYVRSLVVDLGEVLGCGAHVVQLCRLESGGLCLDDAISMQQLEAIVDDEDELGAHLLPTRTLVAGHNQLGLSAKQTARLRTGQTVEISENIPTGVVALFCEEMFIGIGEQCPDGWVQPKRLLKH